MHEITVNLDTLLWIAAAIGTVGAAIVWIKRSIAPIVNPIKQMKKEVRELEARKAICDKKFENDQKQLVELTADTKMIMRSQMLILKHVETGNCTGEVAKGRKELEDYLIDKE